VIKSEIRFQNGRSDTQSMAETGVHEKYKEPISMKIPPDLDNKNENYDTKSH